jgi:transposase
LGKLGASRIREAVGLLAFASVGMRNVAAVALADKNARIVWTMLAGSVSYEPERTVQAA